MDLLIDKDEIVIEITGAVGPAADAAAAADRGIAEAAKEVFEGTDNLSQLTEAEVKKEEAAAAAARAEDLDDLEDDNAEHFDQSKALLQVGRLLVLTTGTIPSIWQRLFGTYINTPTRRKRDGLWSGN